MYASIKQSSAVLVCFAFLITSVQAGEGIVWSDDFEQYKDGERLHGQNGWKGFLNEPRVAPRVTGAQNHTEGGSRSVEMTAEADLVREFAEEFGALEDSGQWIFRAWEYVPSEMTGASYFIMLNTYNDRGPLNWSVQVHHSAEGGTIGADFRGEELPLITDRWVPIEVHIDLDTDITSDPTRSAVE